MQPLGLTIKDNEAYLNGHKITDLAKEYKTPLYVMDETTIKNAITTYQENMKSDKYRFDLVYASKAFLTLEFVKYTLDPWVTRWEQSIQRTLLSHDEKAVYFAKFNLEGLLRGDYQSRMNGYAIGRQNGWMSANDIRELENLDRIPAEEGGDLYLINGNMLPLRDAGAFANTTPNNSGKEENPDEEILEVEEPGTDGNGSGGEDSVLERHNRRGKLV